MTTGTDLIQETRRHLYSGDREELNKLNGTISSSSATFTATYTLGGIQAGSVVEMDTELMYVWAVDAPTKVATIQRAHLGSTAASHTDGALVRVNPKFSDFAIFQAINEDLADLSSPLNGMFQMKTVNLTYNATYRGYDMTSVTDVIDIYEIRYESIGPDRYWPEITAWNLTRNMDTSEFASGLALMLSEAADPGQTLRVRYKAPFVALSAVTDNVTTISGLHAQALDIPPLGAAARLVGPREVKRGFMEHQGEPRRAEEVPAGQQLRSAQGLMGMRRARLHSEAARLYAMYPPRLRAAR
jgi:hypothetical protein